LSKNALLQNEILITWRQHLAIFSQVKAFVFVASVFFFSHQVTKLRQKESQLLPSSTLCPGTFSKLERQKTVLIKMQHCNT
jgi:hypothetical protein